MSKSKRSTSCPSKATFKIPQKCYYYHKKHKKCKWGNFCKYQHELYMEKPTMDPLVTRLYKPIPITPTLVPAHKLEMIRESLRKA